MAHLFGIAGEAEYRKRKTFIKKQLETHCLPLREQREEEEAEIRYRKRLEEIARQREQERKEKLEIAEQEAQRLQKEIRELESQKDPVSTFILELETYIKALIDENAELEHAGIKVSSFMGALNNPNSFAGVKLIDKDGVCVGYAQLLRRDIIEAIDIGGEAHDWLDRQAAFFANFAITQLRCLGALVGRNGAPGLKQYEILSLPKPHRSEDRKYDFQLHRLKFAAEVDQGSIEVIEVSDAIDAEAAVTDYSKVVKDKEEPPVEGEAFDIDGKKLLLIMEQALQIQAGRNQDPVTKSCLTTFQQQLKKAGITPPQKKVEVTPTAPPAPTEETCPAIGAGIHPPSDTNVAPSAPPMQEDYSAIGAGIHSSTAGTTPSAPPMQKRNSSTEILNAMQKKNEASYAEQLAEIRKEVRNDIPYSLYSKDELREVIVMTRALNRGIRPPESFRIRTSQRDAELKKARRRQREAEELNEQSTLFESAGCVIC
jgi:ferredoxin-NADP reductase